MELRTLKTFIKVAELLNFSKAAEALGYTQSTVSVHIGQLETELHTRLFERFGKNVRLTAEGLSFLYYAERIIEAEREAANYMLHHMEPHGTLIIGAVDSINCYLLPPLLLKYHEQYPGVNVIIKTASMEILFEWLEHNEIDLACVLNENLYSNKYIKIFEAKTPVRFIVNVSHPLADHPHISLDSLTSQDFILTEKDIGYRRDLDIRLSQYERHVEPFLETGDAEAILRYIRHSNAVTFLPEYVVYQQLRDGSLRALQVDEISLNVWIHFLYLKKKWVTPQMRAFAELIQAQGLWPE
ncbi:LysR family transcriptional regulator [Enterocloster asparagiformis]|jgi:DNA-binding transcriptional LysR family regulator|uniref:LysR substrate binding domain protein n=2 Tax=Enterocloster asparagiformis TaxID=333367 RepID=C0CST0_9FIRM|nr:LysR family transcriptional regulator [Enterocloster asparagiformis]EEG57806.1 LysR substrate binding domain protein [[Clostridium] asparagiforme DSM 15981]RGX28814.1 LysR family transcriptional regulator [Enterocloster asparagiformis]UWO77033.1 LysR family transcriptional regulator [[Clostridium] asparagiforme DSM 15981]